MADELIDILDETGKVIRQEEKGKAHKLGSWHQTAHIWIYNSKKQVLLQKRSKNKDSHPGLWDIPVGGHFQVGEKPKQAAVREATEEIGLRIKPESLKKIKINN